MDCDGSQGVVDVCLLELVRDCTESFFCLCFSTFLFIYIFGLFIYVLWIFFWYCRLIRNSMIGFFLCSELSSFDLLYVEGEMSDFWRLRLSWIYFFGSGIFISKFQFTVRSKKIYLILDCESVVLV